MRQLALWLVMFLLLLSITSFPSPDLPRASAIEQESKQIGQTLLVEGAVQSSPEIEVPPAPPADAEQKEQASGDVQERGVKDLPVLKGDLLANLPVPCPTSTAIHSWTNDILLFQGAINTLPSPHWLARNGSNACTNCTYFGTSLFKSKIGGSIDNVAFGVGTLYDNTCGNKNTATGRDALTKNHSGSNNTATGALALARNITGSGNTALGYQAGINQTTGSNNIYISNPGSGGESGTIRIGLSGTHTRVFLTGVKEAPVSGVPVVVAGTGQLGYAPSSRRYKEDIHDLGKASEGLRRLRPVAFRYKADAVAGAPVQDYGLVAEEVAEVYPELVGRNANGEIVTVHYQKLIPMLLNELLKQQNTIQQQQRKNDEFEARLAKLESK